MPRIVDHASRRQDFIRAACETLLEEGYANTTVRAVAKRAGFTTGALVHYFGDKDELIRRALDYFGTEQRERMLRLERELEGRAALRAVVADALPTDLDSQRRWRIWMALWYHSEESDQMRAEQKRRYREWLGRISRMLEQSVKLGELPASVEIRAEARAMVAFVDGLGVQFLMANSRLPAAKILAMLDTYLNRLYAKP